MSENQAVVPQQPAEPAMSEFMQVINQPHRGTVEYVPFGGQDKVKLTVAIIQNLIAEKTKQGKSCSERDAIKFLAMCQARRLNPFEGDAFLIGYDSQDGPKYSLITAHQAFLKRAEVNPEYDGMKSGVIVRNADGKLVDLEGDFYNDETLLGGWATVYFKTRKIPTTRRLRLATFNKGYGQWKDNPAGMIVKCAEADALRSSFPTMLGGLYMHEELANTIEINSGPASRPPAPTAFQRAMIAQLPASTSTAAPPAAANTQPPANGATEQPTRRGRPPGSKNKAAETPGPGITGKFTPEEAAKLRAEGHTVAESAIEQPPQTQPPQEQTSAPKPDDAKELAAMGLAPEPEPTPGTTPEAPPPAAAPAADKPPFQPKKGESEPLTAVRRLMWEDDVTEDTLMAFLRKFNVSKEGQKLADLATKKHEDIAKGWKATLLPKLKAA